MASADRHRRSSVKTDGNSFGGGDGEWEEAARVEKEGRGAGAEAEGGGGARPGKKGERAIDVGGVMLDGVLHTLAFRF